MLSDPRIRRARLEDAAAVWPLARDFATSFTPHREAFEATLAALVDAPDTLLVVAETAASEVVGYLLANSHPTFFANGPVAWVEEITVADAARRHGVGRMLMTAAEEWAVESGAAYVSLATRRARDFYLSLALLALSGMADNVSVVIRSTLIQLLTPPQMLGRVSAVNSIFIGSSNELGAFESGVAARLLGAVPAVVLGGAAALGVVGLTARLVPRLRALGRIG